MFRMAVGHSDDIEPPVAIAAVLGQCEEALDGAEPAAGLLFSTYDLDPGPFVRAVRAAHPGVELVGTTSVGEMSSVLGFQEDSVTLALFASDAVDITAGLGRAVADDPSSAAAVAVADARAKTDKPVRLCVTMPAVGAGDPSFVSVLLEALRRELGPDVPILGGGSGPRTVGPASLARQFYGDEVLEDAVPILLFSGPLSFSFGIDTGWRPVGRRGRVTASAGGSILEIDGEPAVAFYQRYLGPNVKPTPANPLAVFEEGSEDFYLRVPIGMAPETGAIEVAGGIPADAVVQLTVAVIDEIFDGTRSALEKALKGYPQGSVPDAALLFSCAIRKVVLGTRTATELEIVRDELGPIPIAGLYCFGEIAPIESGLERFHNETIVAVLLGEPA